MTTYRVYNADNGPRDWVEYVETDSPQEALALADIDPADWSDYEALPLPDEMEYECVCGTDLVLFKRIPNEEYPHDAPESHYWECQNCHAQFIYPPDEINWENERMFAQGYEICPRCEGYNASCPFCHGAGWFKPGEDDDEEEWGENWVSWDDDEEETWGDPYYEEDGYYEMED